jgi:hypothetical protein
MPIASKDRRRDITPVKHHEVRDEVGSNEPLVTRRQVSDTQGTIAPWRCVTPTDVAVTGPE